jgi:peptidoglycan/xylan/chitin deacetylase (PgdA/CDA1 family)
MKNQDRLAVIQDLPARLETDLPTKVPDRFAALSWSDLRGLINKGLDIGAHTDTHPILSKLETPQQLEAEIAGSKARIEQAAGATVRHFCYPNGKLPDVDARAVTQAEQSGYQTAVLAESGFAGPPFHLHQL